MKTGLNRSKGGHPLKTRKTMHRVAGKSRLMKKDFSEIEDSPSGFKTIQSLACKAGQRAAKQAKTSGLPSIFVRDNQIVRMMPDGQGITLAVKPHHHKSFFIYYKPSTVFHAVNIK